MGDGAVQVRREHEGRCNSNAGGDEACARAAASPGGGAGTADWWVPVPGASAGASTGGGTDASTGPGTGTSVRAGGGADVYAGAGAGTALVPVSLRYGYACAGGQCG
ncbi:hypothetical protein Abr02nite_10690 [Paractinoplanes brasiliensis]|nr:hypothetical protein Abr02nite_10690 [Actinoplanes brasiliensis]